MEVALIVTALSVSLVVSTAGLVVVSLRVLKIHEAQSANLQPIIDKLKASGDALKATVDANQP